MFLLLPRSSSCIVLARHGNKIGRDAHHEKSRRLADCAVRALLCAVGFAAFSSACHAQTICPWLNIATASGLLGGTATANVRLIGQTSGTCLFRLQAGTQADSLSISVTTAPESQGGPSALATYESGCISTAAPLKAIGNEAIICADGTASAHGELIIGRVRDKVFTIAFNSNAPTARGATSDELAEKAEEIAEQVAGILF